MQFCHHSSKRYSRTNIIKLWCEFNQTINQTIYLYEEILGYNKFWSKYLTLYFVSYIIEICYLVYTFFFVDSSIGTFYVKLFIFFGVEFFLLLTIITYTCSLIVYQNCIIQRNLIAFCYQIQSNANIGIREMFKVIYFVRLLN